MFTERIIIIEAGGMNETCDHLAGVGGLLINKNKYANIKRLLSIIIIIINPFMELICIPTALIPINFTTERR